MSADPDSDIEVIYIPLLEEGVPVVRPTQGIRLGDGVFRVLPTSDYDPDLELWEFPPGSIVRCVSERHEGEEILVARESVPHNWGGKNRSE
jgi:hypothetical protein